MRRLLLATVAAGLAALIAPRAFATPTYFVELYDQGSGDSYSTGPASASTGISVNNVSLTGGSGTSFTVSGLSANAAAPFALYDVAFSTNAISYTPSNGSDTLDIFVTVQGVSLQYLAGTLATSIAASGNTAFGSAVSAWSESIFVDPTDTLRGKAGATGPAVAEIGANGITSSFSATGNGSTFLSYNPSFGYTIELALTMDPEYYITSAGGSAGLSIPEPASAALLILGMTIVGVASRRRRV